jgi:hypothetical protein
MLASLGQVQLLGLREHPEHAVLDDRELIKTPIAARFRHLGL